MSSEVTLATSKFSVGGSAAVLLPDLEMLTDVKESQTARSGRNFWLLVGRERKVDSVAHSSVSLVPCSHHSDERGEEIM